MTSHPIRTLAGRLLSQRNRTAIGHGFAAFAPQRLQRASEALFDFPIAMHVRASPILLIRIPRTGSVSTSFHVYGQVDGIPHRPAQFYRLSDAAFFARTIKIAVVRNPWDRLLSAYEFLRADGASLAKPNPQTRHAMRGLRSLDHLVFDHLEPNAANLHRLDPTLHHQHSYVCAPSGQVIVDRIFHTEDLAAMIRFLAEHGNAGPMPHLNASEEDRRVTALSPRLIDAIGSIYARDAALFGYHYGCAAVPSQPGGAIASGAPCVTPAITLPFRAAP